MADIKSITVLNELQDFLDNLPAKPCPEYPGRQDFCTVCKRLNQEVAGRCKYSGLEIDTEKIDSSSEQKPESLEFKPVSDEVETKQVVPPSADEDFPMIEIVKPSSTPKKPIEMELLDDIAIEFEVMGEGDEPVEVEALEVEPLDEDEIGDESGGYIVEEGEVEVLQFEAVDENEPGVDDQIAEDVVFEPTSGPVASGGTIPTIVPAPPLAKSQSTPQAGPRPVPRKKVKLKKKPPVIKAPGTGPTSGRKPIRKPRPVKKAKLKVKPK